KWGIELAYSLEQQPLGTMGPLTIMTDLPEHFLVMNGDVLTDLAFEPFLRRHVESGALFTISGAARAQPIDFGVLHVSDAATLTGFEEKPTIAYTVSMGVYAVSRAVLPWIPHGAAFGFDQLMQALLAAGREVVVRVHDGFWMDIGRPGDYEEVCERWPELSKRLLPT
ncbi:MAG: sugar phosphate nucleotidyltransferase, partial [Casimicrobiaceae bacterium]